MISNDAAHVLEVSEGRFWELLWLQFLRKKSGHKASVFGGCMHELRLNALTDLSISIHTLLSNILCFFLFFFFF